MGIHQPLTGAERVARRRSKLRTQGLKLRQIWVPDTKAPGFREEMAETCRLVSNSSEMPSIMALINEVQYWPLDEAD